MKLWDKLKWRFGNGGSDLSTLLCVRATDWQKELLPIEQTVPCSVCNETLIVSVSGIELLKNKNIKPICPVCVMEQIKLGQEEGEDIEFMANPLISNTLEDEARIKEQENRTGISREKIIEGFNKAIKK